MSLKGKLTALISILKWQKKIPVIQKVQSDQILAGKVALIVGGSGGIGFAIAKKYTDSGCKVILAGTNEEKLKDISANLDIEYYIVINLKNVSSFNSKIEQVTKCYGRIDILVCASGIHTKRNNLDFTNITEQEYDSVMDVNLKGLYFLCQFMANYMIKNKIHGHMLIISSQSALEPAWSPYRLSKHGLEGIITGIAQKLIKYNIVVNAIGPGPTATGMQDDCIDGSIYTSDNPIERYTLPSEIAEYAVMLVSHLGDTIVGDTIYMSGGRGIIDMH